MNKRLEMINYANHSSLTCQIRLLVYSRVKWVDHFLMMEWIFVMSPGLGFRDWYCSCVAPFWLVQLAGFSAPGHYMTCTLTDMLSEDAWWLTVVMFFNWSSEFRVFENPRWKNLTFDRLITAVSKVCWWFHILIQWGPPGGGQRSLHVQHFPESNR